MTDPASIQSKILFVDDDASFLQMVRDVFGGASDGSWEIHTATGGGDALQRLRARRMDLAVIDVFMPVMDGLQLLRVLNEEFPALPKVLLTGMPDGNTRAAALEGGAALFLEKPASAAGYQSVFATLNELLRWHQRFSAPGTLRQLGLLDLVKLECKSGNSRLFEVFAGDARGEIYIKEGAIIHAIMPDRRGQSAFTCLTTTPGAVFYLREYVEPIERSVDRQWEFLVMEAAHVAAQLEEAAAAAESTTSPEAAASAPVVPVPAAAPHSTAPKPLPPPMIKMAATPALPVEQPTRPQPVMPPTSLPEAVPKPRVIKAGSPSPTPMETHGTVELRLTEPPQSLPFQVGADPAGFKVEELLLCAEFREVLHELNCADTNKRMLLAEVMAEKARLFAAQLPLGELERVELNSTVSRMVLRYEAKRCLLARTNTRMVQPVGEASADPVADWLARQPAVRGVLAACVSTHDGRLLHRGFISEFPEDVTQAVAREAAHLPDLVLKNLFPAWLVRMVYSRCQLYAFRRQDGAVHTVFLLRAGWDEPAVGQFHSEFACLRVE